MRDRSRPFLTHYDHAADERVELSGATFDNWVAKTANLLVDELGVAPGDRVAVVLPPHWQTAVVTFAVLLAGARIDADDPVAAFVAEPRLGDVTAPEVVGLSLDSFGRPLAAPPPGTLDYAEAVRGHADTFAPRAALPAGGVPVGSDDRVVVAPAEDDASWLDVALSAYAVGAGLVLVRHADPARWAATLASERVTRVEGRPPGSR